MSDEKDQLRRVFRCSEPAPTLYERMRQEDSGRDAEAVCRDRRAKMESK